MAKSKRQRDHRQQESKNNHAASLKRGNMTLALQYAQVELPCRPAARHQSWSLRLRR